MNVYSVEEGSIRKLPMINVAPETLKLLTKSSALAIRMDILGLKPTDSVLQYVLISAIHFLIIKVVNLIGHHCLSALIKAMCMRWIHLSKKKI